MGTQMLRFAQHDHIFPISVGNVHHRAGVGGIPGEVAPAQAP